MAKDVSVFFACSFLEGSSDPVELKIFTNEDRARGWGRELVSYAERYGVRVSVRIYRAVKVETVHGEGVRDA